MLEKKMQKLFLTQKEKLFLEFGPFEEWFVFF